MSKSVRILGLVLLALALAPSTACKQPQLVIDSPEHGSFLNGTQVTVSGRARVATSARDVSNFRPGEILVVPHTNADYVEAIRKATGIITEEGSLTSHAAVIGLRLGIPVIVGFEEATKQIREGAILTVDAQRGLVFSGAVPAGGHFNEGAGNGVPLPS